MLCVWLGLALSAGPAAAQGDPAQGDPATGSPYPWASAAGVCDRAAGPPEDVNMRLSGLVRAEADLEAAVAACREALAAAPDDLRLRFQAGRILLAAGERAGLQPIESAAIAGYAPAQLFWGIAHFTAAFGVLPAPATGARWLKRAAAQGLLEAQLLLGRAYTTGQGVPRDLERAEGWFRTAAASEEPVASMSLGGFLAVNKIDPTASDLEEARNLLESAVRADLPAAKFLLGRLLLEDRPFDRDVARALVLYRQAASQGVPGVAALLVEKLAHGEDFGVDVEEAKTWACTLDDPKRVWREFGDGSSIECDAT